MGLRNPNTNWTRKMTSSDVTLMEKSPSDVVNIGHTDAVLVRIRWARKRSQLFTVPVQNWISKLFTDAVLSQNRIRFFKFICILQVTLSFKGPIHILKERKKPYKTKKNECSLNNIFRNIVQQILKLVYHKGTYIQIKKTKCIYTYIYNNNINLPYFQFPESIYIIYQKYIPKFPVQQWKKPKLKKKEKNRSNY